LDFLLDVLDLDRGFLLDLDRGFLLDLDRGFLLDLDRGFLLDLDRGPTLSSWNVFAVFVVPTGILTSHDVRFSFAANSGTISGRRNNNSGCIGSKHIVWKNSTTCKRETLI
jgi:hypothetical protein